MTTSNGFAFASNRSEHARTLFRLARSSSTSSKLPPLAAASLRTCSVAVLALFKSRAAPTTCAPCAAGERAVSTPRPAETPVTRIRLPFRFTPDKTSSVVEVAPNGVASSMFVIFCLLVPMVAAQKPITDCLVHRNSKHQGDCSKAVDFQFIFPLLSEKILSVDRAQLLDLHVRS